MAQKLDKGICFIDALNILSIEDYSERIFRSNSHGELMHLADYINIAKLLEKDKIPKFRKWFIDTVKMAEDHWERPESVFQHIPRLLIGNDY